MDIKKFIDNDLLLRFEFYNYGHALEILYNAFPNEWIELQDCLRKLRLTLADIKSLAAMNRQYLKNLIMFYIHMGGEKLE